MTDLRIDEKCPCGNSVSLSGFSHLVKEQIYQWHRVHDKHANSMAKAKAGIAVAAPVLEPVKATGTAVAWDGINDTTTRGQTQ